ncbi:MAG: hypothetical protein JWM44_1317 [Bacilli bacterium]|nr:hypothetical protein [Bacilli bacterium]
MATNYINLDEVPEILQKRTQEVIERYESAKLLSVTMFISTPYKDKTITWMAYTVHFQIANYFLALKFGICSNPEWTDSKVTENGMIAAEIIEFVKQCDWLQYGVQEALQSGES